MPCMYWYEMVSKTNYSVVKVEYSKVCKDYPCTCAHIPRNFYLEGTYWMSGGQWWRLSLYALLFNLNCDSWEFLLACEVTKKCLLKVCWINKEITLNVNQVKFTYILITGEREEFYNL